MVKEFQSEVWRANPKDRLSNRWRRRSEFQGRADSAYFPWYKDLTKSKEDAAEITRRTDE